MVRLRSPRRDCRGRSGNALTLAVDETFHRFCIDPARTTHPIVFPLDGPTGSSSPDEVRG